MKLSLNLDLRLVEAAAWFSDNPNTSDIEGEMRALVLEAIKQEREACAKVCDERAKEASLLEETTEYYEAEECAAAIRDRATDRG